MTNTITSGCANEDGFISFRSLSVSRWVIGVLVSFLLVGADASVASTPKPQADKPIVQLPGLYPQENAGFSITVPLGDEDSVLGSEKRDAVSQALKQAIAMEPIPPASVGSGIITQEIRYKMPQADEVYLGWGINGWQAVPQKLRPKGTKLNYGAMYTPMTRDGNAFAVTIKVPSGVIVNYGFWINGRTASGQPVGIWDGNGYPPLGYQTVARPDHPVLTVATLDLGKAQQATKRIYAPLVTQEVLYHAQGVEDVFLVWGINGWQTVSQDIRPSGTVLKDNRMHTPMVHNADTFTAKVQVPSGAIMDYGFLITKMNGGSKDNIWDGAESFRQVVTQKGIIEVDAKRGGAKRGAVQAEPPKKDSENLVAMPYWVMLAVLVLIAIVFIVLRLRLVQTRLSSFVSVLGIHR